MRAGAAAWRVCAGFCSFAWVGVSRGCVPKGWRRPPLVVRGHHLGAEKLTPTPTPLTGHQVSPGCQTARSDGCHMAHSDGAIWHTPLVPYGAHDRCKSGEKLTIFNDFQTLRWCHMAHSIGAIWHTRSVQIYYKNIQFSMIFQHC